MLLLAAECLLWQASLAAFSPVSTVKQEAVPQQKSMQRHPTSASKADHRCNTVTGQPVTDCAALKPLCEWADGVCSPLVFNWLQYEGTSTSPYRRYG
jgi:hypothetical protein